MTTLVLLTAMAALGVDAGYEPAADGQLEYIVQIEPQLLTGLAEGQDITSEIPRGLKVRHFRLTVGNAKLPRTSDAGRSTSNRVPTASAPAEPAGVEASDVRVGYEPLEDSNGEYVIEIPPDGLPDLNQHDLTGDVPSDLAVTRFRISTTVGKALPLPPPPSVDPTGTPVLDQPRQASAQGPVGQGESTDVEPPLESIPPTELNAGSPASAEVDGEWHQGVNPPPSTAPPTQQLNGRAPASGSVAPNFYTTSGSSPTPTPGGAGNYGRRGGGAASDDEAASSPSGPPPATKHRARGNRSTSEPAVGEPRVPPLTVGKAPSAVVGIEEELEHDETVFNSKVAGWHWFPLTITLLLFFSVGGNLYLAYIAWDARARSRMLIERFHDGELTTS